MCRNRKLAVTQYTSGTAAEERQINIETLTNSKTLLYALSGPYLVSFRISVFVQLSLVNGCKDGDIVSLVRDAMPLLAELQATSQRLEYFCWRGLTRSNSGIETRAGIKLSLTSVWRDAVAFCWKASS